MSGPEYPRGPEVGSNAIGTFAIGVSPIGLLPLFDWWQTALNQYANSGRITAILENFNDCVDPTENMDSFYGQVWNIYSAFGYGLDVWGRIVGVSRVLHVITTTKYFGFDEASYLTVGTFGESPFYAGAPVTQNYRLEDDAFKTLILTKALGNICDDSIPAMNRILRLLFPDRGNAWVTDGGDMTMTYSFAFGLSPVEVAILTQSGVLPTPAGVKATILQLVR